MNDALTPFGSTMSDAVLIALIGAVVSVCGFATTAFVYIKLGRVETKVDGKMDSLLAASIGRATAEGKAEGEQTQRDRASAPQAGDNGSGSSA